jgi:uncharacterized protein (DUF934 family)
MPLIKDDGFVDDDWTELADEAPLAGTVDALISFARLERDRAEIAAHNGRIGVRIGNDADVRALAPYLDRLSLVALEFPAFTDGRAYSQARIIRRQLGFAGEIRATGDVLADQAEMMVRCGFDSFEAKDGQSLEVWRRAAHALTLSYQRSYRRPGENARHGLPGHAPRHASRPEAERLAGAV